MSREKFMTGIKSQTMSFIRDPVTVVLAVLLPVIVIEGWGRSMSNLPEMPTVEPVTIETARLMGASFGIAIITGLLGLYQVISSREADRRLVLSGYSPVGVLTTRLITMTGVTVVVVAVNYLVLQFNVTPESPVLTYIFLVFSGIIYAFIGVLIGSLMPRVFEGSLVIAIVASIDAFLSGDSPLAADAPKWFVKYFPLYHPKELIQSAVFDGAYSQDDLLFVLVYIAVLLGVVIVLFRRSIGVEKWEVIE